MVSHKGTEATKERPILFNGEMVRAILDGRKTQTRRVVKDQPSEGWHPWSYGEVHKVKDGEYVIRKGGPVIMGWGPSDYDGEEAYTCPYGQPGDRLWVRESMKFDPDRGWRYLADGSDVIETADYSKSTPSCPSIHMPRKASRILLEITDIRVERVQEITAKDARAEGINVPAVGIGGSPCECALGEFQKLWNSINAKRGYGWDVNPWVWVVEFWRIKP